MASPADMETMKALQQAFPIYSQIRPMPDDGGTRSTWRGSFGEAYDVVFKVDMDTDEIVSATGLRHVLAGYATAAEIETAKAIRANPHINMPLGYATITVTRPDGKQVKKNVSVYKFEAGRNLEQLVNAQGPLRLDQFREVFSGLLEAEETLIYGGFVHKDVSPRNLLVRDDYSSILTDFANAELITDITEKLMPSAGGSKIRDPMLFFGSDPKRYTISAEIYEICKTALFARTRSYGPVFLVEKPAEMDDASKEVFHIDQSNGMLGRVDGAKYNSQIKSLLAKDKQFSKIDKIILKGLSLDVMERYLTFADFALDLREAMKPSVVERMRRQPYVIAGSIALAGIAPLMEGSNYLYRQKVQENMVPLTKFNAEHRKVYLSQEYSYFHELVNNQDMIAVFETAQFIDTLMIDNATKHKILAGDMALLQQAVASKRELMRDPQKIRELDKAAIKAYRTTVHAPSKYLTDESIEAGAPPLQQYYDETMGKKEVSDAVWRAQVQELVENQISLRDIVAYAQHPPQITNPTEQERYFHAVAMLTAGEYTSLATKMAPKGPDLEMQSPTLDPREVHARLYPNRRAELFPQPVVKDEDIIPPPITN